MTRLSLGITALTVSMLLLIAPPSVSANIWNPFDGVPERPGLLTQVRDLLRGLVEQIEAIAGRPVSKFKIPDRLNIGFRPTGFYRPPTGSPSRTYPPPGFRTRGTPPSPIPGDCQGTACHDLAGFGPDTLAEQDLGHTHTPTPKP